MANLERRLAKRTMLNGKVSSARCYYRAAAELLQSQLDDNASPNGQARVGSLQYQLLVEAVTSFIRVISSWAQMEFEIQ